MSEDNFFRLDTPQLTITGDVIDLSKLAEYGDFEKIALGDTVHVQGKDIISFYGDNYQADANGNYSTPYARMLPYVANNEDFKGINVTDGEFCIEGSPVATKQDIAELKRQIKILRDNMS